MNINFCDNQKKVFIKVLKNSKSVRREIIGSKIFSQFAVVPDIEQLDVKTVKISTINGKKSTQINQDLLNNKISGLFEDVMGNRNWVAIEELAISNEIIKLKDLLSSRCEITSVLNDIEDKINGQTFFPVHGDLQKQNIFFVNGRLGLIDFEHFCFAPIELELVNSLFFSDNNCLDLQTIIPSLIRKRVISKQSLRRMLIYYATRQFAQGRGARDTQNRLCVGLRKLNKICSIKFSTKVLNFNKKVSTFWTGSSCFA